MIYINIGEVIDIHNEILELTGGLKGINPTSIGYLGSVLEHIKNDDYYPTFESKMAHLFFSCVKFHPFPDGNKRTAVYLCMHFFFINEKEIIDKLEEKLEKLVLDVAEDKISKDELRTIFKNFSIKVNQKYENKNTHNTTAHKRL
ncbi:hypothetical protein NHP190002_05800 [Helicobacter ailurogastricus]|uniref:type II toxin-antitoxin system death-on-curing family toxin n=1 Tax=Helicobacter ailurogastricus TaxID=1578720 RepID=UPI00244D89BE|nr:type II toxin-antitoxin system death-on-curing family toxin [Helicobacter ailurogastricus]GMB89901.1 hypothetical protein NHP190002_05800 [Helicobacter ailurogastricus]